MKAHCRSEITGAEIIDILPQIWYDKCKDDTRKVDCEMMYPYITLADETEITHSQLIEVDGSQTVEIHFERPTQTGFDSARCVLPTYQWKFVEGFSPNELAFFDEFLHNNAHLLYRYAAQGGVHCA